VSTNLFRLQSALDRVLAIALAVLLFGTAVAFGGAVWWAPAFVAVLVSVMIVVWLARLVISGNWHVLKSPLTGLGLLAIGLAACQSAPIPATLSKLVSPHARELHTLGLIPEIAVGDDPDVALPEPLGGRTPLTIDRPATLRWLGGAGVCLVLFWIVSHFADRLNRLYLIWGSVVAAFLLNTSIAVVQLVSGVDGLFGYIEPGKGPVWAPTVADALTAPGETTLRPLVALKPTPHAWALERPVKTRLIGTLMGGSGAYLALGSLGLPLALALTLQLMAPRGSRLGTWERLRETGQGSLLVLLYGSSIVGAFVVGLLAGPTLALPFLLATLLIGVPSLAGTGLRWKGLVFTVLVVFALAGGVWLGESWGALFGSPTKLPRIDLAATRAVWTNGLAIVRDFPIFGVGMGGFPSIEPYYKSADATSTTAMSSVLQLWVEAGAVGLILLALAGVWVVVRLPFAFGRIGSADRALGFGLVGSLACFGMISMLHWTVELLAVALAAVGVAATLNRWLAGGTDLFVERA
jgi:hypothetical protein